MFISLIIILRIIVIVTITLIAIIRTTKVVLILAILCLWVWDSGFQGNVFDSWQVRLPRVQNNPQDPVSLCVSLSLSLSPSKHHGSDRLY